MTKPVPPVMPSRPATSDDSFLSGRYLCASQQMDTVSAPDAVMLAASINPAKKQARVLDMGAGVGAVSLAVRQRLGYGHITTIEKDPFVQNCWRIISLKIISPRLFARFRGILPKCR